MNESKTPSAECPIHPQFHRGWVGDHTPARGGAVHLRYEHAGDAAKMASCTAA